MINVATLIYQLNTLGFSLWLDNGKLKYRQYKDCACKNEIITQILDNRDIIIKFLNINSCFRPDLLGKSNIYISNTQEGPLSFAQERLWFIEKYEGGSNAYNIPLVFKIAVTDELQLSVLKEAIQNVVQRHEILRTLIKEDEEGKSYQLVLELDKQPLIIKRVVIGSREDLNQEINKVVNHIYNLSVEYPIRVQISELVIADVREYYLSIVIHHIAFDGWSMDIFLRELYEYYEYYSEKANGNEYMLDLPNLNIQYKDFAIWQRSYLTGARLEKQINYWKSKLKGYEALNLITDKTRSTQIDYIGGDVYFEIEAESSNNLRELARELGISLYSVLLAGYYLMLRLYSNQDDIIIGTPVANRHYNQVEDLVGFFVNSLALRFKIDTKLSVREYIQKVSEEVIEGQLHQDMPFEKLVDELNLSKDMSRHPIFQIMFGLQHFGSEATRELGKQSDKGNKAGLFNVLEEYIGETGYKVARFDISTFIDDSQVCLRGSFNYAVSLYTEETIRGYVRTYQWILHQLGLLSKDKRKKEGLKLEELTYLDAAEYNKIIKEWNQTDKAYPDNKTIHQLFEEQVERTPDSIAVIYEDKQLTYGELNRRTNQLACYLRKLGIKRNELIGIYVDRSLNAVIAMLGVLKSGGGYVPIDTIHPANRVNYMLQNAQVKFVLTTQDLILNLDNELQTILLEEEIGRESQENPELLNETNDTIYLLYTSGSTGVAKGAILNHRGISNLLDWYTITYKMSTLDRVLVFSSFSFDLTHKNILGGLLSGGRVYLYSSGNYDSIQINNIIAKQSISFFNCTPTAFYSLLEEGINLSYLKSLRIVFLGGEPIIVTRLKKIIKYNLSCQIVNTYGPTECSDITTTYPLSEVDLSSNILSVPIGKPVNNIKVFILNRFMQLLPIGGIGELFIGGVGVGYGYLNRPELTAERFIANPFQTDEEKADTRYGLLGRNARLYKTGDLVRWLPDGNLEYIGRSDFQVKIRGFRIELGEIESFLSSYAGILQSVVLARAHVDATGNQTDSKYLVGYYVSESSEKLDKASILRYLEERLPKYMVPNVLVNLDHLPLTVNGKLDRKALPDPDFGNDKDSYVAPRNELETKVCKIWAEVLGLPEDKVGITDNFFRLGGDSIISIQLVSRLRQRLDLNISIKDIFSHKSIECLFDNILNKVLIDNSNNMIIRTEQGILSGEVPLLPIQQWFFENKFVQSNHWNQSFIIRTPELDIKRLTTSIGKLVAHHDAFRLRYRKEQIAGNRVIYKQYYSTSTNVLAAPSIKILDIKMIQFKEGSVEFQKKLDQILTKWQGEFDTEFGEVYSIGYLYGYKDGSSRIYFALHHLIVDTVSWRILAEDIKDLYEGRELGDKGSSYRQWVETVKDYANKYESEKGYWSNVVADFDDTVLSSLATSDSNNNYTSFSLSYDQTRQLLQESGRAYHTQINDILLTALGYALYEVTNNKVNHILLEGHGREEIDPAIDVTRTVGWFTTMYPVRLEIGEDYGESIKHIKETLRQIPNKGIGYGVLVGYHDSSTPKIIFNYLGQFDKKNEDFWSITGETSGVSMQQSSQNSNVVNVNGTVIDGRLSFTITTNKINKDTIDELAEIFQQRLESIISYCINYSTEEYTMSDFDEFEIYLKFNQQYTNNYDRLFILPPGGGGAESYLNNIIERVSNKQLVVFNNYMEFIAGKFGSNKLDYITYEQLAASYIIYIKSIQTLGPYNLLGWSFGGVLAFEIARQLIGKGDKVRNVILIDSYFNFKKVAFKTNNQLVVANNINYKYTPLLTHKMEDTNITLFKSIKAPPNDSSRIAEYYAKYTKHNCLDEILGQKNFRTIIMNSDHDSWINDDNDIKRICKVLKALPALSF